MVTTLSLCHIFIKSYCSIVGWPFAALLSVPIAVDMVFIKKMYRDFVQWSLISTAVVLIPMILIDSSYYGRMVIAPWNIVKYNVFGGAGPDLYGREPFSFYFINGFLNFNIVWASILFHALFRLAIALKDYRYWH